jgi:hypothetical protein
MQLSNPRWLPTAVAVVDDAKYPLKLMSHLFVANRGCRCCRCKRSIAYEVMTPTFSTIFDPPPAFIRFEHDEKKRRRSSLSFTLYEDTFPSSFLRITDQRAASFPFSLSEKKKMMEARSLLREYISNFFSTKQIDRYLWFSRLSSWKAGWFFFGCGAGGLSRSLAYSLDRSRRK